MEEKRRSEWLKDSDSITNGQEEKAIPRTGGRAPPGQKRNRSGIQHEKTAAGRP